MTIRNLTRPATILAALGVTSLALVAASPASAIYGDYEAGSEDPPVTEHTRNQQSQDPPVDENGKKSCQVKGEFATYWVPHGSTIIRESSNGSRQKQQCEDGSWVIVSLAPGADDHYLADEAYIDDSGALVLVNPREDYRYSSSGGVYAQP